MSPKSEPHKNIGTSNTPPSPPSTSHHGTSITMTKLRTTTIKSSHSTFASLASSSQQPLSSKPIPSTTEVSSPLSDTATTQTRQGQVVITRGRGLSRSFSVPSMAHLTTRQKLGNDHQSIPPTSLDADFNNGGGTRHSTSSVKHLTCFWWKEKGSCRFSDDDCLYAHHDTGHYTDPPRQLIPGEPALAGRKLDRAMRNLAVAAHRSSGSLSSIAGSRHPSRPSTPTVGADPGGPSNIAFSPPLTSPSTMPFLSQYSNDLDIARLNSDNQFLRNLVDQNSKEKAIMISTIESLQTDNKGMKGELEGLRKAQEQLLAEREGLHRRIKQFGDEQSQNLSVTHSVSNPFGAIGRGRNNTETRFLGGLLGED